MKNYYQILGVNRNANFNEISQAYKKLADKFRPASLEGDQFFTHRMFELEEAYNVLNNPEKREKFNIVYDSNARIDSSENNNSNLPIITIFESGKKTVKAYELIHLRWQTINADSIFIDHIGNVDSEGSRSLRLPQYFQGEKFVISLIASNSASNKKSIKKIEILNKSYIENNLHEQILSQNPISEQNTDLEKINAKDRKQNKLSGNSSAFNTIKSSTESEKKIRTSDIYIYVMLIVLIIFVIIMLIVAYNLNPF